MRLKIRHNMEVAHRLLNDTGKCQNIHGHGMQVELTLLVAEGPNGMAVNSAGNKLEFGTMKRGFRQHIDKVYDHHLLLNQDDDFAKELTFTDPSGVEWKTRLPGLTIVPADPTVENLAKWIAEWGCEQYRCDIICSIEETRTNGAEAMYHWNGFNAKFVEGAR